jgi:DNA primase
MRQLIVDNYVINKPIEDILNLLRISLTNGKLKDIQNKGDNLLVTCPHHDGGHEKTPACNVYIGNDTKLPYGYFNCFVCGEKGSFLKFVAECFDAPESYAKSWLLKNFGGELIQKNLFMGEPIVLNRNKGKKQGLDESILDQYQKWCPYLAKRKLSREICELFKVRYDPKYRQVIFPAYDINGKLVMMTKRSIDTKTFYLDKDVEKPVYCLDYIMKNNIKTALITEGPFDCLTGWEYGFPTVATFGKISDYQIEQLNKSCLTVIYAAFDNDAAGRSFLETLKRKLTKRIIIIETKFPANKKDINDLSKEELQQIIKNAHDSQ